MDMNDHRNSSITTEHTFGTKGFSLGYTVKSTFYFVENVANHLSGIPRDPGITFQHDSERIIISNSIIKIEFRYSQIAFINFDPDTFILAYNSSPNISLLTEQGDKRVYDIDLVKQFDNCTALSIHVDRYFCNFLFMLDLKHVSISEDTYLYQRSYLIFTDGLLRGCNSYGELCLFSLRYPGYFLWNYYMDQNDHYSEDFWKKQAIFVMQNRHLPSIISEYGIPDSRCFENDENYVMIKSVSITPTHEIFHPEMLTNTCRVFRKVDPSKIITVKFVGNDQGEPEKNDRLNERFREITKRLNIGNKNYRLLTSSASKLRETSFYFYNGTEAEITRIYKSLGKFFKAHPAKLGARVGLNASSVKVGCLLQRYCVVDDIGINGHNFTDGCGSISPRFAQQIAQKLGLKRVPSAFQIRFPGFKGVLVVSLEMSVNGTEYDVIFTKEMEKYLKNSDEDETLDIVAYSTPLPFSLNKSFIVILSQNAVKCGPKYEKQITERLTSLMKGAVLDLAENCIDEKRFMDSLDQLPKPMDYSKMAGFTNSELMSEPFLRSLVQALSSVLMKSLYEKQQIPIHPSLGRTMLGVTDFGTYLGPNQVFCQYSETLSSKCSKRIIHKGRIGITRSPLYDLAGIQFVEAVDVPELRHLYDVIVFPARGDYPIQKKMANGDLDGDLYAVFWDPLLLLPESQLPSEFPIDSEAFPETKFHIGIDQLQLEYPRFIEKYLRQERIGKIGNCLAARGESHGYSDKTARQLAQKYEISSNSFKSGETPGQLTFREKAFFNPEHFKKEHQPSYRLNSNLSRIHDYFEVKHNDIEAIIMNDQTKLHIDGRIDIDGWQVYLAYAKSKYGCFLHEIKTIMSMYTHKNTTMAELFSGNIKSKSKTSSYDEKNPLTSTSAIVLKLVFDVMRSFREQILDDYARGWRQIMLENDDDFFSFYYQNPSVQLQRLAVAFYRVSYEDGECLAFPWILWDVIDHVRKRNSRNVGDSFFELGVYSGADPRLNPQQKFDILKSQFLSSNDKNKSGLSDFYGFTHHLRHHTGMPIRPVQFDEILLGFKLQFLDHLSVAEDYRQRLKLITLFIKKVGFCSNVDDSIKLIFQDLYFKIAFQKNPEIFRTPYKKDSMTYLRRFVVKTKVELTDQMMSKLARLTDCQVQWRFTETRRKGNVIIYEYSVLIFGTSAGIRKAKKYLVIDMSDFYLNQADWYTLLVDRSTKQIQQLCVDEQGRGKSRVMPLINRNNNYFGESNYGVRAGW